MILWQEQVPLHVHSKSSKSTLSSQEENNWNSSLETQQMVSKEKPLTKRACWASHPVFYLESYYIYKSLVCSTHISNNANSSFPRMRKCSNFIIYMLLTSYPLSACLPSFISSFTKHLLNTEYIHNILISLKRTTLLF